MADIVITEFMDEAAVGRLVHAYDTVYDPKLVDDPAALREQLTSARALIVRNRTQVRDTLLSMGSTLRVVRKGGGRARQYRCRGLQGSFRKGHSGDRG